MARYTITNRPEPIDFECTQDTLRTVQNAKNLLMCRKGEVPYDRLRGFDPAMYALPAAEFAERLLPELDRVMQWEPDCEVVSADFGIEPDGDFIITVTIEVYED